MKLHRNKLIFQLIFFSFLLLIVISCREQKSNSKEQGTASNTSIEYKIMVQRATQAAKYIQLDQQIQLLVDIQIRGSLPLLDEVMEKRNTDEK